MSSEIWNSQQFQRYLWQLQELNFPKCNGHEASPNLYLDHPTEQLLKWSIESHPLWQNLKSPSTHGLWNRLNMTHYQPSWPRPLSHAQVNEFNSLAPDISNFLNHLQDRNLDHSLWNCHQVNFPGPYWWLVNIGSGNGLVLSGNRLLPEPGLGRVLNIEVLENQYSSTLFFCIFMFIILGKKSPQIVPAPAQTWANVDPDLCL